MPRYKVDVPLAVRIRRLEEQLRKQDDRIGREMEKRVSLEEALAAAYEERNASQG